MRTAKCIALLLSCLLIVSCGNSNSTSDSGDTGVTTAGTTDGNAPTTSGGNTNSGSQDVPPNGSDLCVFALNRTLNATNFTAVANITHYPNEASIADPYEYDLESDEITINNAGESIFARKNEYFCFEGSRDLSDTEDYYFFKENNNAKAYTSYDSGRRMFFEELNSFDNNKIKFIDGKYSLYSFKDLIFDDVSDNELLNLFGNLSLVDGCYVSSQDIIVNSSATYNILGISITVGGYYRKNHIKNLKIQIDDQFYIKKIDCLVQSCVFPCDVGDATQEQIDYWFYLNSDYYGFSVDFSNYSRTYVGTYSIYDGSLDNVNYNGLILGMYYSSGEARLKIKGCTDYSVEELIIPDSYQGYKKTGLDYTMKDGWDFWNNFTNLKTVHLSKYTSKSLYEFVNSYNSDVLVTLEEIAIADDDPLYSSQDGVLYDKNKTTLIYCPKSKSGIVEIPSSVETINEYSFINCGSVTNIVLNSNVMNTPSLEGMTSLITNDKDNIKYLGSNNNSYYAAVGVTDNNVTLLDIDSNCKVLGYYAFSRCSNVETINIPNGVLSINRGVLNLPKIVSLSIPNSVIMMDESAFSRCEKLEYLEFGNGLKTFRAIDSSYLMRISLPSLVTLRIGSQMENIGLSHILMPKLNEIIVDANNTHYVVFEDLLYNKDKSILYLCPRTKSGTLPLPSTVATIEECAFDRCKELTNVILPSGLKSIKDSAFEYSGLTAINLPTGLEEIGNRAFSSSKLVSIVIPENVKYVDHSVFDGCDELLVIDIRTNLVEIDLGDYCNLNNLVQIIIKDDNPFYINENGIIYNSDHTEVKFIQKNYGGPITFSADINVVYHNIFEGRSEITSITFLSPNLYENSLNYLPRTMSSLQAINVPENCDYYSTIDGILYNKDKTSLIYCPIGKSGVINNIPSSLKKIEYCAFDSCSSLTSIIVPEGVETIEYGAFNDCSSLTTLSLPNSIKTIDQGAVRNIGESCYSTYKNCKYLGNSLNPYLYLCSFDRDSVEDLNEFTEISINAGCKLFCPFALYDAPNCETLTFEGSQIIDLFEDEIDGPSSNIFATFLGRLGCNNNFEQINVPSSSIKYFSYDGVIYDKEQTTLIYCPHGKTTMPAVLNTVTVIGAYSFECCDDIESITIPNNIVKIECRAFYFCFSLSNVYIPNSVSTIEAIAFDYVTYIHCEASSKPDGWADGWNGNNTYVEWGATIPQC